MARLVWLTATERDIESIRAFISQDSSRRAATVVRRIRQRVEPFAMFPLSGRRLLELPESPFREVIAEGYRILYRYYEREDAVAILRVIHGRRQLPPPEGLLSEP